MTTRRAITTRSGRRLQLALVALATASWACLDATEVELLQISSTGVLYGQAYLDLNGTGGFDAGDLPLIEVPVVLASAGSGEVVLEATTDSIGFFVMLDVPLGSHLLRLDSAVLGDTLVTVGGSGTVSVELGDTTQHDLGAAFPELTIEEVRAGTPGRRVFTSGIALNQRQSFSDGTVHFKGATAYLRATDVARAGSGITTVSVGDSLRLLGRIALDNGQPVLTEVTPLMLVPLATIVTPVEVTTGVAVTADGGALDAALVRMRDVEITDTSTAANGDFHFWTYTGADSLEVVLRSFLGVSGSALRPDTILRVDRVAGLLTPFDDGTGSARWRVIPRAGSEIALEVKYADVAVTTSFSAAQANVTDTVEIMVTAGNPLGPFGPFTATRVSVSDPIPAALTFLSASATSGSYDDASGLWSVGEIPSGGADTLRIEVAVAGPAGTVTNTATSQGLEREVETNGANDAASATLTIF